MKDNGIASARRTQQHNGAEGLSDAVAPDELPSWHIECKGEKSPLDTKSRLVRWYTQITRDCAKDQIPVVLHKPNNCELVAIVPLPTWQIVVPSCIWGYIISVEDSINPSKIFEVSDKQNLIWNKLGAQTNEHVIIAHHLKHKEIDTVLLFMKAIIWLEIAKVYEDRKRNANFAAVKELN